MNENQPSELLGSHPSGEADPSVTPDYHGAGPESGDDQEQTETQHIGAVPAPFPPKRGEPPAHYLKGPRELWRAWVNSEQGGMGPIGARKENFDNIGHKDGYGH